MGRLHLLEFDRQCPLGHVLIGSDITPSVILQKVECSLRHSKMRLQLSVDKAVVGLLLTS